MKKGAWDAWNETHDTVTYQDGVQTTTTRAVVKNGCLPFKTFEVDYEDLDWRNKVMICNRAFLNEFEMRISFLCRRHYTYYYERRPQRQKHMALAGQMRKGHTESDLEFCDKLMIRDLL